MRLQLPRRLPPWNIRTACAPFLPVKCGAAALLEAAGLATSAHTDAKLSSAGGSELTDKSLLLRLSTLSAVTPPSRSGSPGPAACPGFLFLVFSSIPGAYKEPAAVFANSCQSLRIFAFVFRSLPSGTQTTWVSGSFLFFSGFFEVELGIQ